MRFAVLGRLEVRDDDRLVDLGPARRVAVLAALLVDAGRVVSVDLLAERAWDGRPPAAARSSVQAHVSRLRTALGDPSILQTTPSGYLLAVPDDAIDARRFEARVRTGTELAEHGRRDDARAALEEAFASWRGRPYTEVLADFATVEAERLDELRLSAHELAAELDVAAGRAAAVADRLGPLVIGYPFRERLRAALVVALERTGRRAEALACLREGRQVLVEELGVEPGRRLRELQDALLAEGYDDEPVRLGPPTREPAPVGPAPADRLVGRADELEAVLAACRDAAGGATRFVALRGEAGIGKSRLAEEVAARVAAEGQVVAWGRCWPHDGSPALWPWIEVVRDLDRVVPPDVLAAAVAGRGAAVASVVPELVGDSPRAVGPEAAEVDVFDAFLHVLARVGERTPLLVVIDDAQWADPWSRRLLEYLAGHARELPLTVLVTVRAVGIQRDDAGLAVLAALSRSGRLVALELSGLGSAEVADLAAARLGRSLDPTAAAELHARTDGNPFYVGEIARLVGDEQDPVRAAIPDTVRGVVGQRLAALPAADVEVLAIGAVVGRAFDVDVVVAVSGLDDEAVDDAVDRAVRGGLLRDEPTDEGDLRFTHALLQETLLDETGTTRRRRLHRRIAGALTEQRRRPVGRRPTADRVAHHHLAAGGDADLRTATDLLLEAAEEARSVLDAERLLDEASAAAERIGHDAEGLRRSVRARRISFDAVVRGPADVDRVSERDASTLVVDPGASGDALDLAAVVYAQWTWPMARGRMAAAVRLSDDLARVAAERDDPVLWFVVAVMRSSDRFLSARFEECRQAAAEASALLPAIDVPYSFISPHPVVANPVWEAMGLLVLGRHDEAHGLYATIRARGARVLAADPVSATYLESYDVHWWVFNGDPGRVEEAVDRVRQAERRTGITSLAYFVAMPEAWAVSHRDLASGVERAAAAARHLDGPDGLALRPLYRALHADVLIRAADHAGALRSLDVGLQESSSFGQTVVDAELHRLRARALDGLGGPSPEVAAERDRARAVATGQGARLFLDRLDRDLAER